MENVARHSVVLQGRGLKACPSCFVDMVHSNLQVFPKSQQFMAIRSFLSTPAVLSSRWSKPGRPETRT
eukprot:2437720-Amphidinium_carterae.1